MGKYLKLAEKVITQESKECDISDITPLSIKPSKNSQVDESRERDSDIRDKSDKRIPGLDSSGTSVAAKIYSKVLRDTVWLALDPSFIGDGDEIPVYTITELRMMQGATPEEIRQAHMIKKEIGGVLIKTNWREGFICTT